MKDKEALKVRRDLWWLIWKQAIANMPVRKCHSKRMAEPDHPHQIIPASGQYSALARCLGMKLHSPSGFVAHSHIYAAMQRGYGPKDKKRRALLLKLAGSHGRTFAIFKLKKLGVLHRYDAPKG